MRGEKPRTTDLRGEPLLAVEFIVRGATQFNEPGVFMSFEETSEELAENVRSLGFDLDDLIRRKKLAMDFVRVERSEIEETGDRRPRVEIEDSLPSAEHFPEIREKSDFDGHLFPTAAIHSLSVLISRTRISGSRDAGRRTTEISIPAGQRVRKSSRG